MEPRTAERGEAVVERGAHQRVRERVAADALGVLAQDARGDRLLQRLDEGVVVERASLVEDVEVRLSADDRGDREHRERGLAEPREPAAGDLAHAVGDAGVAQRQVAGALQVPQDLLDEERVALGLLVQLGDEGGRGRRALELRHERRGLVRVQPGELEPLQRPLPPQPGEQRGERLALLVAARRDEEERGLGRRRAHEMGEELEGRLVRPVHVVEHDEQRRVAGDLGQQGGDAVEQPQPLRA